MGKLTLWSEGVSPARKSREASIIPAKTPHRVGTLLLAMALGSSAFAQAEQKETAPAGAAPSRFVDPAGLAPYLESLSSTFLIRGRVRDPFGQTQDPTVKPPPKPTTAIGVHRPKPVQTTPFSDIVRKIPVTTVMPGEKRFLIGPRSFKQGEQMSLTLHGKPIKAQITEVTSKQISFRNLDTGENATRRLDLLPAGMTSGNHEITAPGMIQDRPNAPIDLEAGE